MSTSGRTTSVFPYGQILGKRPESADQILEALENGSIVESYAGSTELYLKAALDVATSRANERWIKVAAVASCVSTLAAIAAVVVAIAGAR
jgi:hypothetical protein